jgi:hypothetical protein
MPNDISTTTPELTDPALRILGNRVVNTAILSIQKAVAHQVSPHQYPISDQPSLEQRFLTFLQQLPVPRQQAAAAKIANLVNADPATRRSMYGDLAQVDLHSAIDLATQGPIASTSWAASRGSQLPGFGPKAAGTDLSVMASREQKGTSWATLSGVESA